MTILPLVCLQLHIAVMCLSPFSENTPSLQSLGADPLSSIAKRRNEVAGWNHVQGDLLSVHVDHNRRWNYSSTCNKGYSIGLNGCLDLGSQLTSLLHLGILLIGDAEEELVLEILTFGVVQRYRFVLNRGQSGIEPLRLVLGTCIQPGFLGLGNSAHKRIDNQSRSRCQNRKMDVLQSSPGELRQLAICLFPKGRILPSLEHAIANLKETIPFPGGPINPKFGLRVANKGVSNRHALHMNDWFITP